MAINYNQAARQNRTLARRLGWIDRFAQITHLLGFTDRSPDVNQFADAVRVWQLDRRRQGERLDDDGVIGANTWRVMEPQTRFSVDLSAPSPPVPEWLRRAEQMLNDQQARLDRLLDSLRDRQAQRREASRISQVRLVRHMRAIFPTTAGDFALRRAYFLGKSCGRLDAMLLYLSQELPTEESAESLRRVRREIILELAEESGLDRSNLSPRHNRVVSESLEMAIAFAEAREEGLIGRSGQGWTSLLTKLPAMREAGLEPVFCEGFDLGFALQRADLYTKPLLELVVMIWIEVISLGQMGALALAGRLAARAAATATAAEAATAAAGAVEATSVTEGASAARATARASGSGGHSLSNVIRKVREELSALIREGNLRPYIPRSEAHLEARLVYDPAALAVFPELEGAAAGEVVFADLKAGDFLIRIPRAGETGDTLGQWVLSRTSSRQEAIRIANELAALGEEELRRLAGLPRAFTGNRFVPGGAGNPVNEVWVIELSEDCVAQFSEIGPQIEAANHSTRTSGVFRGGGQQYGMALGWRGIVTHTVRVPRL